MSGIMCAMPNVSGSTNNFTVTVGVTTGGTNLYYGYRSTSPACGSISPSPANVRVFNSLLVDTYYLYDSFSGFDEVVLAMQGNQTGATWTSITVNGNTYTKAALNNSAYNSGSNTTTFEWYTPATNPFGASGTVSVVFA